MLKIVNLSKMVARFTDGQKVRGSPPLALPKKSHLIKYSNGAFYSDSIFSEQFNGSASIGNVAPSK